MEPLQIKARIEFWFLKYYAKAKEEINGSETFTLFDNISPEEQRIILSQLNLAKDELLVLLLRVAEGEFILNTNCRFIRLKNSQTEVINYSHFEWHTGFKSILATTSERRMRSVKESGSISEFGIRTKDKHITFWRIPTGEPGFGFWNVTKKCELIGRKLLVKPD